MSTYPQAAPEGATTNCGAPWVLAIRNSGTQLAYLRRYINRTGNDFHYTAWTWSCAAQRWTKNANRLEATDIVHSWWRRPSASAVDRIKRGKGRRALKARGFRP